MNKNVALSLFLALFGLNTLIGQGWLRTFDAENSPWSVGVERAADGGAFTMGTTNQSVLHIRRWDVDGQNVWHYIDSTGFITLASALQPLPDGSLLALHNTSAINGYQSYLTHLSAKGALLYAQAVALADTILFGDYSDMAVVGTGEIAVASGNLNMPVLYKVDANSAQVLWRQAYQPVIPCEAACFKKIAAQPDGSMMAAANLRDGSGVTLGDALWWLNASGGVINTRFFGTPDTLIDQISATPDGGYAVLATVGGEINLWKLDASGQITWTQPYAQSGYKAALTTNSAGKIAVAVAFPSALQLQYLGYNLAGTALWNQSRPFWGGNVEIPHNLSFIDNNTLYAAGRFVQQGGWSAYLIRMPVEGPLFTSLVHGKVAVDANTNCLVENGEIPLAGWTVKAEKGGFAYDFYAVTDSSGSYSFALENGTWTITCRPPNNYWETCEPLVQSVFCQNSDSLLNFPATAGASCPLLEVDVSTPFLRRCYENTYTVQYCNRGTATAAQAYVRLDIDPHLDVQNFSVAATQTGTHNWEIPIGDMPFGACGQFTFVATPNCDSSVLGQTHCVEAHIYPDSICTQPSPLWSGASVQVTGKCEGDSVVFTISNIGVGPTVNASEYVIIEDNLILRSGNFNLAPSGFIRETFAANGSFFRCEAEQELNHPGFSMPSASVEGCGLNNTGTTSLGFQTQYNEDDGDPFVSIDCQENQGSFDPNDKSAFPVGVYDDHYIVPGQELEYRIRFQNTGTDTAFLVVIRDTLDSAVDPMSVVSGASSHPYRMDLLPGGVVKYTFENIQLPDSTTNEAASHGFVKFRVQQRPNIPLGTVIINQAAIYFDFNAPVLTNSVFHTVDTGFLNQINRVTDSGGMEASTLIFPNPATETCYVRLSDFSEGHRLRLVDLSGIVVRDMKFTGPLVEIKRRNLASGLYLLQVFDGQKSTGIGRVYFW